MPAEGLGVARRRCGRVLGTREGEPRGVGVGGQVGEATDHAGRGTKADDVVQAPGKVEELVVVAVGQFK